MAPAAPEENAQLGPTQLFLERRLLCPERDGDKLRLHGGRGAMSQTAKNAAEKRDGRARRHGGKMRFFEPSKHRSYSHCVLR